LKKILIIDDYEATRELLAVTFDCFDCQILAATDGEQGLRLARAKQPHIILLDIVMPGLSGFEVCRRLKADPQTANIPIIIISGKIEQADIRTGLNCGAVHYLTKPFSPIELLGIIDEMVQPLPNNGKKKLSYTRWHNHASCC
jgi:CheY-like chemotaxis protein